jgi:translation elongation factor EF-1beta
LLEAIEKAKLTPDSSANPNFFGWWWSLCLFQEPARALWKTQKKPEAKKPAQGKPAK